MKVKVVEVPNVLKHVVFWCAGCGCFHGAPFEKWNGDKDEPSIGGEMTYENPFCVCSVYRGTVTWDQKSKHRLAGKSLALQHEEAWRDGGEKWDEVKPPDGSKTDIKV